MKVTIKRGMQGGEVMPKTYPWHSRKPEAKVYHDDKKCHLGNNIEDENRVEGKGNKQRRCNMCKRLEAKNK